MVSLLAPKWYIPHVKSLPIFRFKVRKVTGFDVKLSLKGAISMKTVHMIVSGRVQAVGFRYSTKLLADQLKIAGWVKNNSDGTVEIVAQAPNSVLDQFISAVKASPSPSGRVNNVLISEIPEIDSNSFTVKY